MKHENNSWIEPFYHLYLLHITTKILDKIQPVVDKFLKVVTKQ